MTLANTLKHYSIAVISTITFFFATQSLGDDDAAQLTADVGYISTPELLPGAQVNRIRFEAIRQAAMSLGAQGGLAWQARNIDMTLQSEKHFLDQIFDMNQLMLAHNALPPVLIESDNNLSLDNDNTLRINAKTYRIIQPARFVTAPPNWRDYLWMRYDKPNLTSRSLLPKTPDEAKLWNHFLKVGWREGENQADMIFTDRLNCLKRDILGMILYRRLLALHMVSSPFVAKAQLGVTGDATHLRIGDQVLRITAQSQLQPNPKKWQPVILQNNASDLN